MPRCCFCEKLIEQGLLLGFWGPDEKTKPICVKCMKKFLDSEGSEIGLKNRIEKWLMEEKIQFTPIFEPNHPFHFTLKHEDEPKMSIEIFQEKNKDEIIVGFMTFLSSEITFKLYKYSQDEKQKLKNKVDEFLSTLRVDYRTGMRVGYEIISEKGHYGAKYFVKSKIHDLDRQKLLNILEMVKETGEKSRNFINKELQN